MTLAEPADPAGWPRLQGAPNFRDLGGVFSDDGRQVRHGIVYRSEVLASVTERDQATLAGLRIGMVFDLRNPSERASTPTAWPQAAAVALRSMPEELLVPGADMRQFMNQLRQGTLDTAQVGDMMLSTYRAMPGNFGPMLRSLFEALTREDDTAALIHCTAGKDRTGFVCAMLLSALQVPASEVMRDYLATARYYTVERLRLQMERVLGQALAPDLAEAMAELAQVKPVYLEAAFGAIAQRWGSAWAYLQDRAGLDAATRARLHRRLLAP